ncbi:dTDP-4-dehydrorhamnose 3,5-epimerase [Arenibacter palladensis]|uniref:dTDP-4-dehydrorhamnose 3,5-epimerase n=1 Tax=Arenibacter palladensis TaxID=237373 RepID=UPI0026E3B249|nr:dTDP-4-dehydrorhamnose 3,5-epimerase [Arenibacter palladensis]MDO6604340.1 dTDP-4-dehydrorhamnose 3,5-epimerase [Arenibacter palladensis]
MKITETLLQGCYVLEPIAFKDERGLFFESYHQKRLEGYIAKKINFVQDNISISKKGVLRGLHYQTGIHSQAKLVQVLKGEVLDVVVDLRKESSTFGLHFKLKLSPENRKIIFIPKGMAHGFLALTDEVIFAYKCDEYYQPQSEAGILFNDPDLNINWEFTETNMILSEKDLKLPLWKDLKF